MANILGFSIERKDKFAAGGDTLTTNIPTVAARESDDGALVVDTSGSSYGITLDLDGSIKTEAELITRYREMSLQPEIDAATDDIVNEFVAYDDNEGDIVDINLDNVKNVPESLKNKIRDEFKEILRLYDFNNGAYEIVRRWYIDGRMYYQILIDNDNPENGIAELRYIDPRKIKKIREVKTVRQPTENGGYQLVKQRNEYYVYSDKGFTSKQNSTTGYTAASTQGIKIAADAIILVTSGLTDSSNQLVLSYLHKAAKPLNNLRAMEDAAVIYRLVRAPERRIFYVDVGSLPKAKAEQYIKDQMVKHRNKLVYDQSTGQVRDDRQFTTMLEDFWLPRRNGAATTEVTTLAGGQNLGQMADVEYFQQKLYKALNVPITRLHSEDGFNLGRSSEISRDELKFSKFIARLRMRFSVMFKYALEKQLVLKGILSVEEAAEVFQNVSFNFKRDNFFTELKDLEILNAKMQTLPQVDAYVGKYFSTDYVKRFVLSQDEEEIVEMAAEMKKDIKNGMQGSALQQAQMADMQQQQAQQELELQQQQANQPQPPAAKQ